VCSDWPRSWRRYCPNSSISACIFRAPMLRAIWPCGQRAWPYRSGRV
ncbi:uncharacterized protein METZ01_LOCUS478779, partial [marine metagenome]